MENKTALITGITGQDGSYLTELLLDKGYIERGKKFKRGAGKTLAHVIQHEMDHLEGVLFVDKAEKMEDESR